MHLASVDVPRLRNVAHLGGFTSFSAWQAFFLASPEQQDASDRQICSVVSLASFSMLSFYQKKRRLQVNDTSVWIDPGLTSDNYYESCGLNSLSFWPWLVSLAGSSIL